MVYLAPAGRWHFLLTVVLGCGALALFQRDCGKSLEASVSVCSAPTKPLPVQDKPINLI